MVYFPAQTQIGTAEAGGLPFPSLLFLQPALGAGRMDDFLSGSFSGQHWQRWVAGERSQGTYFLHSLPTVSPMGCVLRTQLQSATVFHMETLTELQMTPSFGPLGLW